MKSRAEMLSGIRWGAATSFSFGSFGWVMGMTVPGPVHGTSLVATVCFSFVMGALAYIPGDLAGRTIAEIRARGR